MSHTQGKLELEEVASDSGHIKHLCPVDSEGMSLLTVVEHEGVKFAAVYNDEDARRLVAAWNACDGLSTEDLENLASIGEGLKRQTELAYSYRAERDSLRAVNAELLDALIGLDDAYCRAGQNLTWDERFEDRKRLMAARAAIASARKQGDSHE